MSADITSSASLDVCAGSMKETCSQPPLASILYTCMLPSSTELASMLPHLFHETRHTCAWCGSSALHCTVHIASPPGPPAASADAACRIAQTLT